jgi:threonine aldolase
VENPLQHYEFASDNTAAICPEALAALEEANLGSAPPYGEDKWTALLDQRVRELFETDCVSFLVFNGTAANALALAQVCQSFDSIICHKHAHIQTDECGAAEFFTKGSKLLPIDGANGKIDLGGAASVIAQQPELHAHRPRVISISQATELGTIYRRDELASIAEFARTHHLRVHMDGARLANAIAALNCRPKEITWQMNVDALCFGGTKNGVSAGELVIFFEKELAREFDYRLKQGGQLGSKMRFLAAPWLGLLRGEVWLRNARHANDMAGRLARQLRESAGIDAIFAVEANAVFVRFSPALVRELQIAGWHFYKFIEPDIYRLMCSWSTTAEKIDAFVADLICIQKKLSL